MHRLCGERCGGGNLIDPQPLRRDRPYLRERFRRVIIKAGYSSNNGEKILAEWFDRYMQDDVELFVKMLEDYERDSE